MKFISIMLFKSLIVFTLFLCVSSFRPGIVEQNNLNFVFPNNQIPVPSRNDLWPGSSRDPVCSLPPDLIEEIRNYQPVVLEIARAVINGIFKGKVYEELAYFIDKFGSRLSGTKNLEDSLDYLVKLLNYHSLENVHGEPAIIPHWERGKEFATMLMPRNYNLKILGLGGSISTPPNGITAEVLVVKSFDDLNKKADLARGKIIVFNQDWVSYPVSVVYRTRGAVEAAKLGGVASLIRSITPMSLYTPHTGQQDYDDRVVKIPAACITVEDAEMLQRMSDRGEKIVINLYMEAVTKQTKLSRNVVAEVIGTSKRDEIVLLSGHTDSWDVGQGAMDDGAGAFVSLFGAVVLKQLGLRPKRTVRVVLWTAEEPGLIGVKQYVNSHAGELDKFNFVMESDEGTFTPEGIEFTGVNDAACILHEISKLMEPLNATKFKVEKEVGSDIGEFIKHGVPAADLIIKNDKYFWYHHTNADTMTVIDSDDLDRNVAVLAALAYITADLSKSLPRTNEYSNIRTPDINDKSKPINYNQGNNFIEGSLPKKIFDQGSQIDNNPFRLENDIRTEFSSEDD